MNNKHKVTKNVIIFIGLAIAGCFLAFAARLMPSTVDQMIMVAFGSAVFGSGLLFFLIQITAIFEK